MALTSEQNIPEKPKEQSQPWTFRRLFPLTTIATLSKAFVRPLDILLGLLILFFGIATLFGRAISWGFWVFAILVLFTNIADKHAVIPSDETSKITETK